ncbi:MAG: haloacid dehalogenase-like hydrolase [Patescibacteria group bacterium]
MSYVFFDLDKTLIRAQSQRLLIQVLYKRKLISFRTVWRLRFFFLSYKLHLVSQNRMEVLFEKAAELFKGVDVEQMRKVTHAFVFAEFADILNFKAVEELEKHISAGKQVVLTSGKDKVTHLAKYDFTGSFAYSDHHSDLPLLIKATYRYAVSPTRQLRDYAKSHGWFILE